MHEDAIIFKLDSATQSTVKTVVLKDRVPLCLEEAQIEASSKMNIH